MSIQYMALEFEPTTFGTWVPPITTRLGLPVVPIVISIVLFKMTENK